MESSIEIKIQALDKMLEMRKQLITMQDNLGMFTSAAKEIPILIYQTEEFFEVANEVGANVVSGDIVDQGMIELLFDYKEASFHTYILPGEYQLHEHEIDRGNENA